MTNSKSDVEGIDYIYDSDIIDEITLDDEDLPDISDNDEADFAGDDADGDGDGDGSEPLHAVACSPKDATLVATGGENETVFLWRIGLPVDAAIDLGGHSDTVTSLSFSADGKLFASGGMDGVINVWDTTGNLRNSLGSEFHDHEEFEWIKWHPSRYIVLAGSNNYTAWVFDANTSGSYALNGHGGRVTCGDFACNGDIICTCSSDSSVRIWNQASGDCIHVVKGHSAAVTCLAVRSCSNIVLTGGEDGSLNIVNIATGKVVNSLSGHADSIECIEFGSSGLHLAATGSKDQKVIIWDLRSSSPRCILEHEVLHFSMLLVQIYVITLFASGVYCLAWLGTSRYLATGSGDGVVSVWDSLSGIQVKTFNSHSACIQAMSVSCDQKFLVTVSDDGTAQVFDILNFI